MASRAPAEKEKLEALARMDLVKILRAYILAVVSAAQGYKALLVDKETMRIASTLLGRTELGEHGIVLVERLETTGKDHHELKVRTAWPNKSYALLTRFQIPFLFLFHVSYKPCIFIFLLTKCICEVMQLLFQHLPAGDVLYAANS
jgi:hypothetical protein